MGAHRQRAAREGRRTAAQSYWPANSSSIHAELHGPRGQSCPYSRSYRRREGHRLEIGRRIQGAGYRSGRARRYAGCDQVNVCVAAAAFNELSVSTADPVSAPTWTGSKSMAMVQFAPPAKVCGLLDVKSSGQVEAEANAKLELTFGLLPLVGGGIVSVALPMFETIAVCGLSVESDAPTSSVSDTSAQTGSHPLCGCGCCHSPR